MNILHLKTYINQKITNISLHMKRFLYFYLLKLNPFHLRYAEPFIQSDKPIILNCVKQYGWLIMYADINLKADQEIVLTAVKKNGHALQFIDQSLHSNLEIVLAAVNQDGYALQYADLNLRNNRKISNLLIRNQFFIHHIFEIVYQDFFMIRNIDLKFYFEDRDIIISFNHILFYL